MEYIASLHALNVLLQKCRITSSVDCAVEQRHHICGTSTGTIGNYHPIQSECAAGSYLL